ncbi:MAG: extracellular solute-binding protein, partial [Oscillospiraceae bacterium]|nr:extracellular solute-binding protein [Oscillospiraceae bacterium]
MKKRLLALLLAALMLLTFAACGGEKAAEEVAGEPEPGKALPADAVLDVVIASHASWPYNENWEVWKAIREGVGGTLNVNAYPETDFSTKFTLIMADPENLPDVIGFQNVSYASKYFEQGAFLALDDNLEYMPNYEKFWGSVSDEEKANTYDIRRASDGKVYTAPAFGNERQMNVMSWLYRKDIFDKHGLQTPETLDDLYNVCKELKKLYPESYPLCMRSGMANMNVIGSSFKPNFHYNTYYDFENEKWSYGARESEIMLEMVTFFKKMVDEKLIPADFFTINASTWQELVSTDRGFIMPEYQVRIDFFNDIARAQNPEYTIAAMKPPKSTNGIGVALVNKYNNDPMGFGVPNTADAGRIANAMRYINWFYSDEGAELVSWGKEGET